MKKIKLLLVFVLLLMPCMVMADMDAPSLKPYDIVVVAQDGIDYYDYQGNVKGHLNKDDIVTITAEYGDAYSIKVGDDNYSYKLNDLNGVVLLKEELIPEEAINDKKIDVPSAAVLKLDSYSNALVYADSGVDVRKGPSTVYEKVGHLDKNTTIKYLYAIGDFNRTTHIYVDANNVKGWVEILNGKVLLQNTTKFITYKEVKMSCAIIPKDTILSPKYVSDPWTHRVLIEYGSCEDTVNYFRGVDGVTSMFSSNYIANAEMDIYEGYDQTGEKLGTIPVDANFVGKASVFTQGEEYGNVYVTYDGKTGWVKTSWNSYKSDENNPVNKEVEKEITIEEEQKDEEDAKLVDTDKKETNLNPVDYVSMYVIIGLSVALIAAIIVILVNRKKKVNTNQE